MDKSLIGLLSDLDVNAREVCPLCILRLHRITKDKLSLDTLIRLMLRFRARCQMARLGIGRLHLTWSVPWARRPMTLKRGAPWTDNRTALSTAQLKADLALAEAAYGVGLTPAAMGKLPYKGKSMPAVAVLVADKVPKGEGTHGGRPRLERRRRSHDAAAASIAVLRSLIAARGG